MQQRAILFDDDVDQLVNDHMVDPKIDQQEYEFKLTREVKVIETLVAITHEEKPRSRGEEGSERSSRDFSPAGNSNQVKFTNFTGMDPGKLQKGINLDEASTWWLNFRRYMSQCYQHRLSLDQYKNNLGSRLD